MATRRFKINPGESIRDVTAETGAATNSKSIELTVDRATTIVNLQGSATRAANKHEVSRALRTLADYIDQHGLD